MADQSTNIPYAQGMDYGMGVNLLNGDIAGRAVDPGDITGPVQAGGQTVHYNIIRITSFEELYSSIGISVEASGHYGLFSASGKFSYAKEAKFNSQATFLVARCVVENAFTQAENPQIKPDATELIQQGKVDKFQQRYGDGFVRGIQAGGEFFAVISITSDEQEEQESISAALQAKYGGLFASVDVNVNLDSVTKTKVVNSEVSVSTYQKGGVGDQQSFTSDVEAVMARLKTFPAQIKDNPVPYDVQVASYDTLALPAGPNPIDIQAQKDALVDYARIQLTLLAKRNDIEFLQLHSDLFVTPPTNDILTQWQEFITDQLNQLTRQASKCADNPVGGCDLFAFKLPPDYFMPERKLTSCPNIAGSYRRSDDPDSNFLAQFVQDGRSITASFSNPAYSHAAKGEWNGTYFDFTVTRRNLQNSCVTLMFATIKIPSSGYLVIETTGSDGRCDLPTDYSEIFTWTKL